MLTHITLPELILGNVWPAVAFIVAFIALPKLWTSKKLPAVREELCEGDKEFLEERG